MWYSTGTVSVTNGSSTVTGSGTAFLANARIGDGIVIQGSTAMHEIIGIASDTSLTIRPAYGGTTGTGRQFAVAPMLGYDKDLSDAFNEIRLQFGDTLSALKPWAYAATENAALDALGFSTSGKSVATGSASQGRSALGLASAAMRDATTDHGDATPGRLVSVGGGGLLGSAVGGMWESEQAVRWSGFTSGYGSASPFQDEYMAVALQHGNPDYSARLAITLNGRFYIRSRYNGVWGTPREVYNAGNTTVDSNGFIKAASPIIKLHSDRMETEAAGTFQRLDTGHYQLTGTNGLRLDDGWYIETPHDKNGNKYFNVEWEQDHEPSTDAGVLEEPADVTLTIRCYERVWNPETGLHDNGDPVDIPDGRWIDLRMNEVRVEEPEMPDEPEQPVPSPEPADPIIPNVVTMAQAKLALLYADLYTPVEQFINELPEPQKTAALIEWNHRQTLERDHPLVAQAASELGLTDQLLDELFMDAARR